LKLIREIDDSVNTHASIFLLHHTIGATKTAIWDAGDRMERLAAGTWEYRQIAKLVSFVRNVEINANCAICWPEQVWFDPDLMTSV
jgi:hypothetical protein